MLNNSASWEATQFYFYAFVFAYVFECFTHYYLCSNCVFLFKLVFEPSKTFGMVYGVCDLILLKNRNFCSQSRNFVNSLERSFDLKFLQKIDIQIALIFLIFQNFWSYISIIFIHIFTDCSVLDRFCSLLHSSLILMMLWIISGGISHGEVRLQYNYAIIKYESIYNSA